MQQKALRFDSGGFLSVGLLALSLLTRGSQPLPGLQELPDVKRPVPQLYGSLGLMPAPVQLLRWSKPLLEKWVEGIPEFAVISNDND